MSERPTHPRAQHDQLVGALARLEGALRRNHRAQADLAQEAHGRAQEANLQRAALVELLEGGDAELSAQDLAHGLTDTETRLRRVGMLLDGSAQNPDVDDDALDRV